ncbi:AraC family transcriptional regulator [Leifsonia sp. NPDC056665]|uniref:AraC family transcriptional regulator n=1 Tax=Leifsonia sp. NPDC056665 TaxID=3345901 RepID=UPI00367D757F
MSGYTSFASTDVDESAEIGSRLFYSHTLTPTAAGSAFSYELGGFQLGSVSIGSAVYGCGVRLAIEGVEEVYGVSAPSLGGFNVTMGRRHALVVPGEAVIVGPVGEVGASGWDTPDDALTMVRFNRRSLEAELARMLGLEITRPIDFSYVLNIGTGRGAEWWQIVRMLCETARSPDGLLDNQILRGQFESLLMDGLLLAADHPFRESLDSDGSPTAPPVIRRAIQFVDENAWLPITVSDIAAAAGVGYRTLQRGFIDHLGTTPGTYLSRVRLEEAHKDLLAGAVRTTTVASVASKWGFHNLGRFATRYRQAFGVSPAETLRRG